MSIDPSTFRVARDPHGNWCWFPPGSNIPLTFTDQRQATLDEEALMARIYADRGTQADQARLGQMAREFAGRNGLPP